MPTLRDLSLASTQANTHLLHSTKPGDQEKLERLRSLNNQAFEALMKENSLVKAEDVAYLSRDRPLGTKTTAILEEILALLPPEE